MNARAPKGDLERSLLTPAEVEILLNSATRALCVADLEGNCRYVNSRFTELFGVTRNDALGTPVRVFLKGLPELKHSWVYERMESHELALTRQDGSYFPARVDVRELVSEGRRTGLAFLIRNCADEKLHEEVLRKTERLASAGRMAAAIAHEINNPLEAVMNLLFLMRNQQMTPEATRYLSMAETEIERVARIARQTLAFYRDTGKAAHVDVRELLNIAVDVHAFTRGHARVHRRYRTAIRLPAVADELQQVFHNLIGNAVDAGATDLWLRVNHHREAGGRNGVRITVADNGSGIDETARGRIFHPFFTTKGETGTGLGLWVSRGVILRHEGSIRVRTSTKDPCKGTCFRIFLPL